jgi:hypothetical protein
MDAKQDTKETDNPGPTRVSPFLQAVIRSRHLIAVWMVVMGIALFIGAIIVGVWFRDAIGFIIWPVGAAAWGISILLASAWQLSRPPEKGQEAAHARILVLTAGGMTGFVLTLVAVAIGVAWWADISSWLSPTSEGKNLHRLAIAALGLLAGLVLMFASLQVARTEERTNAFMRRMLYGYNAVLTGLLVLLIVTLLTVGVSATVKAPLDFTASKDFTLSDKSIKILQSLKTPVDVTFIHGFDDPLLEDQTDTLLKNAQNYTDKIEVKELWAQQDQAKAKSLKKTYPGIDLGSLLLVYKTPGSDKQEHRIIAEKDLVPPPDFADRGPTRSHKFIGEDALMTVLSGLSEEKELPTLYFVQGHGELDPNDAMMAKVDTACGVFKKRLEARKSFEIKTLAMDPIKPEVPAKASVLAILGPRTPFSDKEVKALQDYLAKGGRMLVMLDLIIGRDKKIVKTGLEPLLAQHGVGLGDERIITLPVQFPLAPNEVLAVMNRKYIQQNPLVPVFVNERFQLADVRPLNSMGEKPGSPFLTMPLMIVGSFSFADSNLAADPDKIVEDLLRNEEALKKKAMEIQASMKARGPLTVAVAVTEPEANDPHAGMAGPSNPKPKMMVIGCASMASNQYMDERAPLPNFDFLSSVLEWLRGKDQNINIEAKVNKPFMLSTKSNDEKNRMIFLPPFLVVGSVLGLACGVWIVRRR